MEIIWDDEVQAKPKVNAMPDIQWDDEMPPSKRLIGASGTWEKRELKPITELFGSRLMDPKTEGLPAVAQDVALQSLAAPNQFLFNLPRAALNKIGYDLPEARSKAGKAIEAGAGITGAVTSPFNKMVLGSKLLAKAPKIVDVAAKGAALAGLYTPQTGEGDILALKERGKQALLGAGLTVGGIGAGKALKMGYKAVKGLPTATNKVAGRLINSIIKPLKKDFSYGKNPGEGVVKEGIVANSFDDLVAKISGKKQEVGKQIDKVVKDPVINTKTNNYSEIIKPLDDAISEASKSPRTNSAVIKRLNDTKLDILGAKELPDGTIQFTKDFSKLTPSEAVQIKRDIGQMTKWTGNASDDKAVNMALKRAYGTLKEKINKAVPELAELNERYANLETADIAAKYRDKIIQRQNALSITPKLSIGGGVLGGFALGNPILGTLIGLGAAGLEKALASTAFKTRLAKSLSKIGAAEASKVYKMFPKVEKAVAGLVNERTLLPLGKNIPSSIVNKKKD